ncbi:MAG: phosphoenolpyruvate--protein phosphotransferase [Lachnospiraceae bacterium]|nr:phosphoenolpyruvate--protein phosphotransferase [Lachnospiraceae bacterium]
MECIKGNNISNGVAYGKIFVYVEPEVKISTQKTDEVKKELRRFSDARKSVRRKLVKLLNKTENKEVIEAHIAIVDDVIFEEMVEGYINKNATAECAVLLVRNELCKTFEVMTDKYLKERSLDIKDVSNKIIKDLLGVNEDINLTEHVILMAYELTPSQAISIDKEYLLGFATETGGINSHTAILARENSIPAISGIKIDPKLNGKSVLLDGYEGCMYIEPDQKFVSEIMSKYDKVTAFDWSCVEDRPKIYANISTVADAKNALKNGAEGVGLFRTEFIYLGKKEYPTEEEQYLVYKEVAKMFEGKPVVIRTCDLGSDKKADYLGIIRENNPALGYRGIRFSLDRKAIFKTQIRAILRAAVHGDVSIMFPMVISVDEVVQAKKVLESVKKELKKSGEEYGDVKIGIMIETPAAVMISDELAKKVDFFSIGTNDLTQYTLAVDRQNALLASTYDIHHPAIMKMIKMVVDNGHKAGIEVGMCGELASDVTLAMDFVKMGIDALSLSMGKKV